MISIVIPTYNEAGSIGKTLSRLWSSPGKEFIKEIIIVDGGSSDETLNIAKQHFARTIIIKKRQRATQLNAGAAAATAEILFFLHADSEPEKDFISKITNAINNNYHCGCFRLLFDTSHWFLSANAWFTRFNINAFRFGDQGLFVTKKVFNKSSGFNEKLVVMEDQEIIHRLKKFSKFKVIDGYVTTSARKYIKHGVYKTQGTFFVIWLFYYLGMSQKNLVKWHRHLL